MLETGEIVGEIFCEIFEVVVIGLVAATGLAVSVAFTTLAGFAEIVGLATVAGLAVSVAFATLAGFAGFAEVVGLVVSVAFAVLTGFAGLIGLVCTASRLCTSGITPTSSL